MKDVIDEVIAEDVARRDRREVVAAAPVATYDELRQQLADVSNERDGLRVEHDKRYRALIDMRDERDAIRIKLNASEALLREMRHEDYTRLRDIADMHNRVDAHLAQSAPAKYREHILYRDGDAIGCIPESILDRNGQVALAMCSVCGKGEAELTGPCAGGDHPAPATDDHRVKCGRTLHYFLGGACKYCNEPAPATDEQGAGS